MTLSYAASHPVATDGLLADAEERLGLSIPTKFREFLRTVGNGGRLRPAVIRAEGVRQIGLTALLGVRRDDSLDLEARAKEYIGRFPPGFLPIADAEGGNLILVSTRAIDAGSVWFWDHETEAVEGQPADLNNMSHVADDFGSFSDAAVDVSDLDAEELPSQVQEAWIDPGFLARLRNPPD